MNGVLWKILAVWRLVPLLAICLLLQTTRFSCERSPNMWCNGYDNILVGPGECVEIEHNCEKDNDWEEGDHIRLRNNPPSGLYMKATNEHGGRQWYICATEDVPMLQDEVVHYRYVCLSDNPVEHRAIGESYFVVTTDTMIVLTARCSAEPAEIAVGDSAQLVPRVYGGTPPYVHFWSSDPYDMSLSAWADTQWVHPEQTTTYYLQVTDDELIKKYDTCLVTVGMFVDSISATPDTIDIGGSTQLYASAQGGLEPYSYSWVPVGNLSDGDIANPIASNLDRTQLFQVTMFDAAAGSASDTVRVYVRLQSTVAATPDTIESGGSSQLGVIVAGGNPIWIEQGNWRYAYQWSPSTGLSDDTLYNPVASPTSTTEYTCAVTDYDGLVDTVTVTVVVTGGGGGLEACIDMDPPSPYVGMEAFFSASCSSGEPIFYKWWFDYDGDPYSTPDVATSEDYTTHTYGSAGTYQVRLEITDAQDNTDDIIQQVVVTTP